jgi:Zn-dependent metalloprotease
MKNLLWLAALLGMSCAHRIDPAVLRLSAQSGAEITAHEKLATPAQVKGVLADLTKIKKDKRSGVLLQFLQENTDIFKIQSPETELRLVRSDDDELGFTHFRYERLIKKVPVYGDELILHVNNKAQLYLVNGQYHPSQAIETKPAIPAGKAGEIALKEGQSYNLQTIDNNSLVLYPSTEGLRLAWHIVLSGGMNRWDFFIDAQEGSVLFNQDRRRY